MNREEKFELLKAMLEFEKTALTEEDMAEIMFILSKPIKRHQEKEERNESNYCILLLFKLGI